jgi:glycosyltransferase involved in cell wall biosynthesis
MRNIVPIKIYEYMAAGKPVITTRLEGVVREFGDANGVVYVDDPQDVPDEAIRLDKERLVRALGQNAYEFVRRFDWAVITEEFESILGRVRDSRGK